MRRFSNMKSVKSRNYVEGVDNTRSLNVASYKIYRWKYQELSEKLMTKVMK